MDPGYGLLWQHREPLAHVHVGVRHATCPETDDASGSIVLVEQRLQAPHDVRMILPKCI